MPTAVADHILPAAEFPELRYTWSNLEGLCTDHDHTKARMESYARKNNCLPLLVGWCADPMSRPQQFRPMALRPVG